MKRKEIEGKLASLKAEANSRIAAAPIPAFFIGISIGVLVVLFWRLVITLMLLGALIVGALWLLGEGESGSTTQGPGESGGSSVS